jgi:hypothetical protein
MDPTVCFYEMTTAWEGGDIDAAIEHARILRDWLARGGFRPVGIPTPDIETWLARVLAAEAEHET